MAVHAPLTFTTFRSHDNQLYYHTSTRDEIATGWLQPAVALLYSNMTFDKSLATNGAMPLSTFGNDLAIHNKPENLDWEAHRPIIVDLYQRQKVTMAELIAHMTKNYNFKATKRMYHTRFTVWGVYKYTKSGDKDKLALQVVDAHRQGFELPKLTAAERRKLSRHAKTSPALEDSNRDTLISALAAVTRRRSITGESVEDVSFSSGSSTTASSSQLTPDSATTPSPSPPLSSNAKSMNLAIVLLNTRQYYQRRYDRALCLPSELSKRFWTDIKDVVYLHKVGSFHLVRPLLQNTMAMVNALCTQQPFNIMRELCATLSPTNMRTCSRLRIQLLRFFAIASNSLYGAQHPLTIVCHQLQLDNVPENSTTVLHLMIDDFKTNLPGGNLEVYQTKRSLVSLLRRGKDYPAAQSWALSLMEDAAAEFGSDHKWTRLAMTEFVHTLMDENRWDEALRMCQPILERGQRDLGGMYPDDRSVYVMEDMAKICAHLQRPEQSLAWLENALDGALKIWAVDHSCIHIYEKLDHARSLVKEEQSASTQV